jgi:cytochrome P450
VTSAPTNRQPPVATPPATPVNDADPFGHDILEDPAQFHADLRDAAPVVYLSAYDVYAMGRYEQVHAALTSWQDFESSAGVGLSNIRTETQWRRPGVLLEADPPLHDAPRAVLSRILGPRALRRLHNRWTADAVQLVDQVLSRGLELDAVTDLAAAFPLRVFPDAVGIPTEGRENLLPYGDHIFNTFGPHNDLVAKGAERAPQLLAYAEAQCARENLTEDGFGARVWAAADRGDITLEQAPLVVRTMLSAGVDTTVHSLAGLLFAMATNPTAWRRLREDRSLVRSAFDEAVRWESPVQTAFRTATEDIQIGDTLVPAGKKILMFLGSANRDPRRWQDPTDFDLDRDPSGHVGFGMGIHQCVGQHVARLEAQALLNALADRVAGFELASPPTRHHNNTLRAWASLPVRLRL